MLYTSALAGAALSPSTSLQSSCQYLCFWSNLKCAARYEGRHSSTSPRYQTKKAVTTACAAREETVAHYVRELTSGFDEAIESGRVSATPVSPDTGISPSVSRPTCVLITGATGGLGAHLVAEAATRGNVSRVICLNRRSKQDARQRQEQALRKKGINLSPNTMTKIDVMIADLSRPQLGLSDEVYHSLLSSVTHIVHNAWLMHSTWPVKRFEPQLRGMAHMLQLARDISIQNRGGQPVTFEFISSIATVGHHPLWTGRPVVPEERVPIESVLPTGYGDAKYICERMIDATLHRFPDCYRATAVRLGQIAGSRINGHWNPMEHVPFLIKSSQTLRALPNFPGTMGWTPADDIAGTLIDIIMQPDGVSLYPIYHIENPIRQPWGQVIDVLAKELGVLSDATGIIPFEQWVQRVRDWPAAKDNSPEGCNPAHLLVDFLDANFIRMSCGGLLLGTAKAREHSPTLAKLGPVSEELIRKFVDAWKDMGFLS